MTSQIERDVEIGTGLKSMAHHHPAGRLKGQTGMLIRATLAQNVGTGCAFSGLSISMLALQERLGSPLGATMMALSLTVFSMIALGPAISSLIARWSLRVVMSVGVLISMTGYLALAFAQSLPLALAACGLLIGPGTALFAALPPAVLASSWYPHDRGKAMGIAYLPLLVTVLPMLGIAIIQHYGLTPYYLALAAIHLLLFPLMLGVAEPQAESQSERTEASASNIAVPQSVILGGAIFWLIALGDGILNGTAIAGSAHMLPIVTEYGISLETGAMLLSISGASSIAGSLLAGYATDRLTPSKTLGLAALGFLFAWATIAVTGWLPALAVSAALIGFCGASVFPPISALVAQVYGASALPKVLGLLGIMTLPFTFLMPPAAGWLRDLSGTYDPVFALFIGICVLAGATFFGLSRYFSRKLKNDATFPCATRDNHNESKAYVASERKRDFTPLDNC